MKTSRGLIFFCIMAGLLVLVGVVLLVPRFLPGTGYKEVVTPIPGVVPQADLATATRFVFPPPGRYCHLRPVRPIPLKSPLPQKHPINYTIAPG